MEVDPDEEPFYDDGPDLPVDAPDPLQEAILAARHRNLADGRVAFAVAHLLAETRPREAVSARVLVAAEIAAALGLGTGAATRLVDTVVALTTRLHATFTEVRAGRLDWYKATILVDATAALTGGQARQVEEIVLGKAAGRTPARHADAVRRAVARVDPDGADARRRQAKRDVTLIRAHCGDGMGQLFARMDSPQLDAVWTGADTWARNRKADGDPRSLDQLRVASLVQWAQSYLHHGDPTYCDRWCTPDSHHGATQRDEPDDDGPGDDPEVDSPGVAGPGDVTDNDCDAPRDEDVDGTRDHTEPGCGHRGDQRPVSRPPSRHGRPVTLAVLWDLASLLGVASRCGELADSGAVLPPEAMRDLVAGGVAIRRMIVDDASGELLDLTARSWPLPRTAATDLDAPVTVSVLVTRGEWDAIRTGTADPRLLAAIADAPQAVRDLLDQPGSADTLDATPDAYPAPARLAEFIAVRDRHPVNPTAGPTAASAADLDHTLSVRHGGTTTRTNLASVVRHWHRLKTLGGWQVQRHHRGWQWTSPHGHTYTTQPYDYRLGP